MKEAGVRKGHDSGEGSAAITRHGQPFEPTYPNPQTEEEKRVYIAEARAANSSGFMQHDSWPLPEMYPGHYEDLMGLSRG